MTAAKIIVFFLLGLGLYYLVWRVMRRSTRQAATTTMWFAEPFTVLFGGGRRDPLHLNPKAAPFREALSSGALARARERLDGAQPGDVVPLELRRAPHPRSGQAVVLADGWIGDYSGRVLAGAEALGQPTALRDGTLYGTHLFGQLHGNHHLVPTLRLVTRARVSWNPEDKAEGRRSLGRPGSIRVQGKTLPMRAEAPVVEAVLPVPGDWSPGEEEELELLDDPEAVQAVFRRPLTRECFDRAEGILRGLADGCDRWEMMAALHARLITLLGNDAIACMDGYLNFQGAHRWTRTTPQGIFLALPFGWLEAGREVPQLTAVFHNGRLLRVLPHAPQQELEGELGI